MRLVLSLPPAWPSHVTGTTSSAEPEPGIGLEVSSICELPEDVTDWLVNAAQRDCPAPLTRVEITTRVDAVSELGWPLAIQESSGYDEAGTLVEVRTHVLYVLVEHCAVVALRGRDPSRFAARRDELLAVARTGRPEWGVPAGASLAELLAT